VTNDQMPARTFITAPQTGNWYGREDGYSTFNAAVQDALAITAEFDLDLDVTTADNSRTATVYADGAIALPTDG